MKHSSASRRLTTATLILFSCPALFAQAPPLKTPDQAGAPTTLSLSLKRDIVPGRTVTLVTQEKPLLRQLCKVEQFEQDTLVCRGKSEPVTYHGQDLVAIIGSDHEYGRANPLRIFTTLGLGGGALAGAALLASIPTAGIPLAVVGAFLLLDSLFETVDMEHSGTKERLLYMNPDQRLQVDLK